MVGALATLLLFATAPGAQAEPDLAHSLVPADSLIRAGETHFAHLWRLSLHGESSCPRWSPDGSALAIESSMAGCGRVLLVHAPALGGLLAEVVNSGRTIATSPAFLGTGTVLYSSYPGDSCRTSAARWRDQKWPLNPSSALHVRTILPDEESTDHPMGADTTAIECATSPDGKQIVYTATPANDPEIYVMNADRTKVRRLTVDQGYDGGACFSPDGKSICFQAYHPREESERAQYVELLTKHVVSSALLDIWIMGSDGSNRAQVTDLGETSMAPSFTPDGKRIIFSSDYQDPQGRQFDLYITKLDGGTPEKITNDPSPDGYPLFSPDGRYLAFTSGRGAAQPGAQDVFIAEWK